MTYDSRSRDRFRLAVTGATALVAAAAITATGWVAGAAAHDKDQADAQRKAEQDALARAQYAAWKAKYGDPGTARQRHPRTRVVLKHRPTRTRVTTRYVTAAATPVGSGGTVSPAAPAAPAPQGAGPVHAAPPPPPPPAPTHGS